MGFSVEWVAFKDMSADAVCDAIGAQRTGEHGELFDADLMGAELPNGMYLLFIDGRGKHMGMGIDLPEKTGIEGEAFSYTCQDNSMTTMLSGWRDRQQLWDIMRYPGIEEDNHPDDDASPPGFSVNGELPEAASRIMLKAQQEQQKADEVGDQMVDYLYEVTADLGYELTGFQHDRQVPETVTFEILTIGTTAPSQRPAAGAANALSPPHHHTRKPWWKFW